MRKNYRLLSLILAICLLGVPVFASHAQTQAVFSKMIVEIWPEYDRPSVLVILHITLSPDTPLPVELSLQIPSEVGEPNAVAVRDANGSLFSISYNREVNGAVSKINFVSTMPEIQFEYYDNRLVKEGKGRHFEYSWAGDYSVNNLTVKVQQPVGVSDMRITPGMGSGSVGQDGLVYFTSEAGSLQAGKSFDLILDYQKETDQLSAEGLQVKPSAPVSTISPAQRNLLVILPWLLGSLGLVLIVGGGVWWYWQSGFAKVKTSKVRQRRKLVLSQTEETLPEGHIYCHHCGKRALSGDRFCRACGTRLRT